MCIYYTKCGKTFKKSSKAEVTGYIIDVNNVECMSCPFKVEVTKGWPPAFERWECRAGSLPPNHNNNYYTSSEDNSTCIYVKSLDMNLFDRVIKFCKQHEGFSSASFNQDEKDCRKCLSITVLQNKKGVELKKAIIKEFFTNSHSENINIPADIESKINNNLYKIDELKKLLASVNEQ